MLEKIELRNYRCFDQHEVSLKPLSVIVGANNAGKSTLIEALRLLSIVVARYRGLSYRSPPTWTNLPSRLRGVAPSLDGIDLRGGSIFHRYGNPPASVVGHFSSGVVCELYIGEEDIFAVIKSETGENIVDKAHANRVQIPSISILPQIGPLLEKETKLTRDYVLSSLNSSLASRHFRNQLHQLPTDTFQEFQRRSEASWRGLHIESLELEGNPPEQRLTLLVRDGNFTAEIGWMGHGVQMWLQTMWFLSRSMLDHTVILDEPDVYMHADLQRKLIRLLRSRSGQTLIATHSVEIMSEVGPDEILVIDKQKRLSNFAATLPAVQSTIDKLGGVQNIHLARLWSSRKCLHVEGKDAQFLKIFQDLLQPDSETSFLTIPRLSIGGWSGWSYAVGSTMNLRNAAGDKIVSYCLFDSDYHLPEEIAERYADANARGIQLHVWRRKEIENYLLVPTAIRRILEADATNPETVPSTAEIKSTMEAFADDMRNEVHDSTANEFLLRNRSGGLQNANARARELLEPYWAEADFKLARVSGKELLSRLSRWTQQRCSVSFGALRLARELRTSEVDIELATIVRAIDSCAKFPNDARSQN